MRKVTLSFVSSEEGRKNLGAKKTGQPRLPENYHLAVGTKEQMNREIPEGNVF